MHIIYVQRQIFVSIVYLEFFDVIILLDYNNNTCTLEAHQPSTMKNGNRGALVHIFDESLHESNGRWKLERRQRRFWSTTV